MKKKDFRRKFLAYFLCQFSKRLYNKDIYISKKDYDRLLIIFNNILEKNIRKETKL